MSRAATLLFAIISYAIFFATFLYLIVFVGDFPFSGRTVDVGPESPVAVAAIIDLALIALFGLQHSVMARQGFKRWWTKLIPWAAERSMYVLAASVALMILFLGWRPIPQVVWSVTNPLAADLIWLAFWAGWGIVLLSTFLINHFELFGLQQAWLNMIGAEAALVLSLGCAPALRRLFPRILGRARDDRRASPARGRHVVVHADRHPLRGARPDDAVR